MKKPSVLLRIPQFQDFTLLWRIAQPFHRLMVIQLILCVLYSIANAFRYVAFKGVLQSIGDLNQTAGQYTWIAWTLVFLASAIVASWILHVNQSKLTTLQFGVIRYLKSQLFQRFLNGPVVEPKGPKLGERVSHILGDTAYVEIGVFNVFGFFRTLFETIAILIYSFYLNPVLGWPTLILFVIMTLTSVRSSRGAGPDQQAIHKRRGETAARLIDALNSLRVIKVFQTEKSAQLTFENSLAEIDKDHVAWRRKHLSRVFRFDLAKSTMVALLIVFGGVQLSLNQIDLAKFTTFIYIIWNLTRAVREMSERVAQSVNFQVVLNRLGELLKPPPQLPEGQLPLERATELVFEGVGFRYTSERPEVFHDVSFRVKKGETVIILGPNGQGKSTLLSMIPRLIEPTEGRVALNGRPISEYTIASLRSQISLVGQEIGLLDVSIRDNIRMGKPSATDAEVDRAAEEAGVAAFASQWPTGLETVVGENNSQLSRGQAQRIAIARAILRNSPILILDEPTASLDRETSLRLSETLQQLAKDRITMIVTHQPELLHTQARYLLVSGGTVRELRSMDEVHAAVGSLAMETAKAL